MKRADLLTREAAVTTTFQKDNLVSIHSMLSIEAKCMHSDRGRSLAFLKPTLNISDYVDNTFKREHQSLIRPIKRCGLLQGARWASSTHERCALSNYVLYKKTTSVGERNGSI